MKPRRSRKGKIPGNEAPQIERRFEQIIGHSPALESVLAEVEGVAPTDSTALIFLEKRARVRN